MSAGAYELTPRGRQLGPVLIALSRWGALEPVHPEGEMGTEAFMLMLKALFATGGRWRRSDERAAEGGG